MNLASDFIDSLALVCTVVKVCENQTASFESIELWLCSIEFKERYRNSCGSSLCEF